MKSKCFMSSQAAPQGQLGAFQGCPLPGGEGAGVGVLRGSPRARSGRALPLPAGPGPADRRWTEGRPASCSSSFSSSFRHVPPPTAAGFPSPEVSKAGGEGPFRPLSLVSPARNPGPLSEVGSQTQVRGTWTPGQQAWALGCGFVPQSWAHREPWCLTEDLDMPASRFSSGFWSCFQVQTKRLTPKRNGVPALEK